MKRHENFTAFYGWYLSRHSKMVTRIFHFASVLFTLWVLIYIVYSGQERFFWYLPLTMLGLPALSHAISEKNRPTGLRYPLWTIVADFRMFFELLTGKEKFKITP
ncbi:Mpo1-like protein [Chryseobacterium sp. MFBS3-17]|uniref:Mpo1-like protein n=1 Tax=Chryseobacterium sp. MFBS3-17 TaxID=2886689 RepID=UPI001D0E5844|nr:Mpo1-like protein [Chryseobacterium sp. MFBS3-17]MCC2589938.1 DUF962 domain-containing protein [Chryseobacterium sp. MFBS3-17]